MTAHADANDVCPVLVLGLGNRLLSDDAVGLELLRRLRRRFVDAAGVTFIDGGTQGIALLRESVWKAIGQVARQRQLCCPMKWGGGENNQILVRHLCAAMAFCGFPRALPGHT